ncbi:MAG: nucleotidyltransferase family protein [Rhizobiaceae bacterium]|nr:nucleotidyltransferase family protein [Rhizobiaceae bacterium]
MSLTMEEQVQARDWLCRTLSPYYADETPPAPPQQLWPEIVRLSDAGLVAPRLYRRTRDLGFLPAEVEDVLSAVFEYATLRARGMRSELEGIIRFLNDAGLEPVLFKGAEWLMGHYAPGSLRLIGDIDIWFPTGTEQQEALRIFQSAAYMLLTPVDQHNLTSNHHYPPLHKENTIARVELHHQLIRPKLAEIMDLTGTADRLRPAKMDDLRYRRLAMMDGVTIAYLQSGHMGAPPFETRRIAIAKWLDFMDRFAETGHTHLTEPREIGILTDPGDIDVQLLTALSVKFGFPYRGKIDTAYTDSWVAPASSSSIMAHSLRRSLTLRNLLSPSAWWRFVKNFRKRLEAVLYAKSL